MNISRWMLNIKEIEHVSIFKVENIFYSEQEFCLNIFIHIRKYCHSLKLYSGLFIILFAIVIAIFQVHFF